MRIALLTVALSSVLAGSASAQNVTLTFHDGLVSIEATSVPVRVILAEWGKKGGTKVIGTDRLTGAPLTLKLVNVPEAKALETILRSAAGYMAAPRAAASTGSSLYDRILVMPTSSTPAPAVAARPAAPTPNTAFNGTQRFVPPRPQQQAQEPDNQDDPDPNPPNPPVFTFPQPGQNGVAQPGTFTNGQPGIGQPYTITVNPQTGAPQSITIAPPPTAPSNMPTMPAGAATPGVIMAPQPAQQPGTTTRPPGRQ